MRGLRERIKSIERRLVGRAVIRATVLVASITGAAALAAALAFPAWPRWPFALPLALGPILGLWRARRDRPTGGELVLFLDRRIGASEALVTAWEVGDDPPPLLRATVHRAEQLLAEADPRAAVPALGAKRLGWLAPALALAVLAQLAPVPAPSADARVAIEDAAALRRIEHLADEELDPARQRRLEEAARLARELSRQLRAGMDREEAQAALDAIRRELEAARRDESAGERRARDAAIEALATEPDLARALAERDPDALNRATERAAARREAADRRRAREALRRAADAARAAGDDALADSLLRRERLLRRRAEQAQLARELAEALPELQGLRVRRQLESLERDGEGGELSRAMVDAMREAWSRLTPEERRRLAEAMQRAEVAENREARAREQEASRPLDADELERQLREALENLDRLQLALGQGGMPVAGAGAQSGSGGGASGGGSGPGGGGPGRGGGPGGEGGQTDRVQAGEGPLARVRPELGPGAPSQTTFEWVDPEGAPLPEGMPEGGAVDGVAAGEPGAIERSPIPEDYREHVRTYFGGRSDRAHE